jgi:hypothetical protein
MVEVLRGGGMPKAEVLALVERPLLLSQGQVSVTTEWSNDPEDLVVFAGDHGLMGKILELTGYLPSGAPVTMCGLVQAAVKVSAGGPRWWINYGFCGAKVSANRKEVRAELKAKGEERLFLHLCAKAGCTKAPPREKFGLTKGDAQLLDNGHPGYLWVLHICLSRRAFFFTRQQRLEVATARCPRRFKSEGQLLLRLGHPWCQPHSCMV